MEICHLGLGLVVREENVILPIQVQVLVVTCFTLREPIVVEAMSHEEYLAFGYWLGSRIVIFLTRVQIPLVTCFTLHDPAIVKAMSHEE